MKVTQRLEIAAPIEAVFAVIADVECAPEWSSSIDRVRRTSPDPLGVGSTFVEEATFVGLSLKTDKRVTAFEPPRCYAETTGSGLLPHSVRFELTPTSTGTRLSFELSWERGRTPRLLAKVIDRALKSQSVTDLARLGRLAELRGRSS